MSLITYPLNNIDYTAEDAELFHCTRKSGIWAENSFMIFVNENKVTIGRGIVWINNKEFSGKVAAMKSSETIDMGTAPSTNPRIDVIALQFNANTNETILSYKKGKESGSPVMPEIQRDTALYEFYLCSIYRRAGATSITWNDVTDLRFNESLCGLMADSVTQVDTSAINAQISALIERFNTQINNEIAELQELIESMKDTSGIMFTSEWVKDGVIPVLKGGTGAGTAKKARENLEFIFDIGSVASENIAAGAYREIDIVYNKNFTKAPAVFFNLYSTSEEGGVGNCVAAYVPNSGTKTGCKVRIYNGDTTTRAPALEWKAMNNDLFA